MNILKTMGIAAGLTLAAYSTAQAVDYDIADTYVGSNTTGGQYGVDVLYGQQNSLGIYGMTVDRDANDIMTVRIYTNTVNSVGSSHPGGNVYFGDLFMSVKSGSDTAAWQPYGSGPAYSSDDFNDPGNDTTWEFAYDLNGARYSYGSSSTSARLREIDDPSDSGSFDMASYRNHIYKVDDGESTDVSGSTNIVNMNRTGFAGEGSNYLEFIFDVGNTALATANQIAFHWTSSLAKDVIEGVVDFDTPPQVSEPAALSLLLAGLGGVAYRRRKARA
ncbi:PEP-CTERM sorting domain-containing protein [Emcibacter sp.]|uniref:PEP-CTERM sorting domain-containing protein n=1 Tax=Emcibacter sp. TaxID=1979954 RepID=UPI003A8D8C0F